MDADNFDLTSLTADLDAITRAAEQNFRCQPRPTRNKLRAETRTVFQKYAQHGSQARLRHNIKNFLEKSDEGLEFEEVLDSTSTNPLASPADTLRQNQNQTHTRTNDEVNDTGLEGGFGPRSLDAESASLVCAPPHGLPFHLHQEFMVNPNVPLDPDVLVGVDHIFGLYAEEAKALLKHHCEKYGDEPVFRAGVREFVMR